MCAGNTETTQRVADTVLKAFAQFAPNRIPAASQGTMNLIGVGGIDPRNGRSYTYIETIAGGQGGRPGGDGMDGVQCNMTNTMNTPVEALEISYPLRVERYELREDSGGAGRHRGGHGVVRSLTVIDHEARVSLQSDRRRFRALRVAWGRRRHDGSQLDARPGRQGSRASRQGLPDAARRRDHWSRDPRRRRLGPQGRVELAPPSDRIAPRPGSSGQVLGMPSYCTTPVLGRC